MDVYKGNQDEIEIFEGTYHLVYPTQEKVPYQNPRIIFPYGIYSYAQIFMNKGKSLDEALNLAIEKFENVEKSVIDTVTRIPKLYLVEGDLRVWDDSIVTETLQSFVPHAPKLIHYDPLSSKQKMERLPKEELMSQKYPPGERIPQPLVDQMIDFMHLLTFFPKNQIPSLPPYWPEDGNTIGFAQIHSRLAKKIYTENYPHFKKLYQKFQVPIEPLKPYDTALQSLEQRPFCFLHFDLHRDNMFDTPNGLRVIDFDLAEWGDPLFELAMCLQLMHFPEDQEEEVIEQYLTQVFDCKNNKKKLKKLRKQLDIYRMQARIKSTLKDIVVCAKKRMQGQLNIQDPLFKSLVKNYRHSCDYWGVEREISEDGRELMEDIDSFIRELTPKEKGQIFNDLEEWSPHKSSHIKVRQSPDPMINEEPPVGVTFEKLSKSDRNFPNRVDQSKSSQGKLFTRPIDQIELIWRLYELNLMIDEWTPSGEMANGKQYDYVSVSTDYRTKPIRNLEYHCQQLAEDEGLIIFVGKDRVKIGEELGNSLEHELQQIFMELDDPKNKEYRKKIQFYWDALEERKRGCFDLKEERYNTNQYLSYIELDDLKKLHQLMNRWQAVLKIQEDHLPPKIGLDSPLKAKFAQIIKRVERNMGNQNSFDQDMLPFEFSYRLLLAKDIATNMDTIHEMFVRNRHLQNDNQDMYQLFFDFWDGGSPPSQSQWTPRVLPEFSPQQFITEPLHYSRQEQELIIAMQDLSANGQTTDVPFADIWKITSDLRGTYSAFSKLKQDGIFRDKPLQSPHEISQHTCSIEPTAKERFTRLGQYMDEYILQDKNKGERIKKYYEANKKYSKAKQRIRERNKQLPWMTEDIEQVHATMKEVHQYLQGEMKAKPESGENIKKILKKRKRLKYTEKKSLPFEAGYRQNLLEEIEEVFLPSLQAVKLNSTWRKLSRQMVTFMKEREDVCQTRYLFDYQTYKKHRGQSIVKTDVVQRRSR